MLHNIQAMVKVWKAEFPLAKRGNSNTGDGARPISIEEHKHLF